MPVWADNATENELPAPVASATSIEVLKFMPKPPYSSGTAVPSKPNAPALSINDDISAGLLAWSISSKRGHTSAIKKSRHDWAIICCSSVNSSGINTCEASVSLIKNSPPLSEALFWVAIMLVCCFWLNLLFNFSMHAYYFLIQQN